MDELSEGVKTDKNISSYLGQMDELSEGVETDEGISSSSLGQIDELSEGVETEEDISSSCLGQMDELSEGVKTDRGIVALLLEYDELSSEVSKISPVRRIKGGDTPGSNEALLIEPSLELSS